MEGFLNVVLTIFWAIVGFGVLVFVHELGHMLIGIATGIKVERFSIGYGPGLKFKIKGIEFKLSVIPLGGYCKFKGQEDFGTGQSNKEPDDFYSRPTWARLLTVLAGPVFNIIIAIILFTILFLFPTQQLANRTIVVNNTNSPIELKTGDEIIKINGKEVKYSEDIVKSTLNKFEENIVFTVIRNGEEIEVTYKPKFSTIESGKQEFIIGDSANPVIGYVSEGSPAFNVGLKVGDVILKINDKDILFSSDVSTMINEEDSSTPDSTKIKDIKLTIQRSSGDGIKTEDIYVKPIIENGKKIIGIAPVNLVNPKFLELKRSFGESFLKALDESYNAVWTTLKGLGMLFSGKAEVLKNVSGPIAIFGMVGTIGAKRDFSQYIYIIAMISILLGFFNLLPIPAVDGGHIILTLIEIIIRKPLSMKVIQTVQIIGVVLILVIFVVVAIKDIIGLPELIKMFG